MIDYIEIPGNWLTTGEDEEMLELILEYVDDSYSDYLEYQVKNNQV